MTDIATRDPGYLVDNDDWNEVVNAVNASTNDRAARGLSGSLTRSTAYTVSDSTPSPIDFDVEEWDDDTFHDTVSWGGSILHLGRDGTYEIKAWIPFEPSNSEGRFFAWFQTYPSADLISRVELYKPSDSLSPLPEVHLNLSSLHRRSGSDDPFLQLFVYQQTGGDLDIPVSGLVRPRLQAVYLRP